MLTLYLNHSLFIQSHKNHSCFCRNHFYGFRETGKIMQGIKIVSLNPILLLLEYYLILNIPLTSNRTKAGPSMSISHCWTISVRLQSVHVFASHHLVLPVLPSDFLSSLCLKILLIFLLFLSPFTFFLCEPKLPATNMASMHLTILAHFCYFLPK